MKKILFLTGLVIAFISLGTCFAEAPTSEMLKSMSDEELKALSTQIASSSSIHSFFNGGLEFFSGVVVFGVLLLIPAWFFGKGKFVATVTAMSFCMGLLFGLGNSLTMPEGLSQVKDEINQRQKSQIASTTTQPEKGNKNTQEKESHRVAEEKKNENGKPVADDVLQSFRDSVTDDEMKKFLKIAKIYQYSEAQVRDFAAYIKMVGVDFSKLSDAIKYPNGFRFKIDSYNRRTSEGDLCFLYDCALHISTEKDNKTKVKQIFIAFQEKSNPMYTLYLDGNITGDFSDMFLNPEAREKLNSTVEEYVSNRSGKLKDNRIPIMHKYMMATKDAFSDESKWKGGNSKEFGFLIPYSPVQYTVPSEVYGEKEKENYTLFLFNKNGELLLALDAPTPKEDDFNTLLKQAVERVKL